MVWTLRSDQGRPGGPVSDSGSAQQLLDQAGLLLVDAVDVRHQDEQAEQDGGDDALAQQDASFILMMMTLVEFLPELFTALGGEEIPQGI